MKILEPNMYVRINNDIRTICIGIGKIKKIVSEVVYVDMRNDLPISFEINKIANASHNIVDLIECGDYVNGSLVREISKKTGTIFCELGHITKENYDGIYSIVTKECFKSMQYEVK